MILRLTITALCLAAASSTALALSMGQPEELVCPIDGTRFHTNGGWADKYEAFGSYRGYGTSLDLRRTGATLTPWPLPKCLSNGFVMYKKKFSPGEIARLRRYVNSAEYQALKDEHAAYYLAAKLRAHLGEKPAQLRYTLLQATWEAKSRSQYARYATEALEAFKNALLKPYSNAEEWIFDQFVAGELERRLGQFDNAIARFDALTGRKEAKEEILRDVVKLQLHLAGSKDSRDCTLSEPFPGERAKAANEVPKFGCSSRDLPAEVVAVRVPIFKGTEAEILYQQAQFMEASGKAADAVQIYRRAERLGFGKAAKRLGEIYDKGLPGVGRELGESMRYYRRARELGEAIPPGAAGDPSGR